MMAMLAIKKASILFFKIKNYSIQFAKIQNNTDTS